MQITNFSTKHDNDTNRDVNKRVAGMDLNILWKSKNYQ